MGGRLSTHVLDTSRGVAAAGVAIEVYRRDASGVLVHLKTVRTNVDGRTDGPLLLNGEFIKGVYELTFLAGDYFRAAGVEMPDPPFLDRVTIRFGIADPSTAYHVPLLLSPYGYSTYRGS